MGILDGEMDRSGARSGGIGNDFVIFRPGLYREMVPVRPLVQTDSELPWWTDRGRPGYLMSGREWGDWVSVITVISYDCNNCNVCNDFNNSFSPGR